MNSILDDESRAAAPYPCLLYAASSQLYIIITKLTLSSQNAGIVSAAARFFDILIHGEAEGILDNQLFARALVDLVRKTAGPGFIPLRKGEGDLIELLFGVANKIRLDPEILPAWFYPDRADTKEDTGEKAAFAGATRQNTFPLFYCLVEYVYHDGRTGDFARTGLLYLTETASKSKRLEKWMIESDLATLMASGLGALYSRLSRSLPSPDEEDMAPIFALSDHAPPMKHLESSDFHSNVDAFLSFLLFWQDTLDHCGSQEVNDTLLDHFQILFLEQLLYPSLLESSDVDGGSTASLITYLVQILESLDHPDMIQRILEYLLAAPGQRQKLVKAPKKANPRMSLSRRKSLDVLHALAEADNNPSPDLFNLVDLISMSLRSKNTQTAAATLRLLTVILRRHHNFAFESLFKVVKAPDSWSLRTIETLDSNVRDLFESAEAIYKDVDIDKNYSDLLSDVASLLERHTCYILSRTYYQWPGEDIEPMDMSPVVLARDEHLVPRLVELLETFFANDVLINLALTEAIASLASCQRLRLDDWLLKSLLTDGKADNDDVSVFTTVMNLTDQVRQWRKQFPEWEALIIDQRARLMEQPNFEAATTNTDLVPSTPIPARTPLRTKKLSVDLGSQMLEAYSDSVTPRGRNLPRKHPDNTESVSSSPSGLTAKSRTHFTSPLRHARVPSSSRDDSPSSTTTSPLPDLLRKQITLDNNPQRTSSANPIERLRREPDSSPAPSSGTATPRKEEEQPLTKSVSLGHVLTNAVVLQQFLLELAAIIQTRASMFEEVRFD